MCILLKSLNPFFSEKDNRPQARTAKDRMFPPIRLCFRLFSGTDGRMGYKASAGAGGRNFGEPFRSRLHSKKPSIRQVEVLGVYLDGKLRCLARDNLLRGGHFNWDGGKGRRGRWFGSRRSNE